MSLLVVVSEKSFKKKDFILAISQGYTSDI
jgi:hypothetical protein